MQQSPDAPFDRIALRRRRDRAAATMGDADFLLARAVEDLDERLSLVKRRFRRIAVIGAWDGSPAAMLERRYAPEILVQIECSPQMAQRAATNCPQALTLVAEEEALPLAETSFDLVVSPLVMHWTNDLPGALVQIARALKPDGLFMGAMYCGETLATLRHAFLRAEAETTGGASPRIAPMAELRDLGGLLQRAGFALPVADRDTVTVSYAEPLSVFRDLRRMGETNALAERHRRFLRRDTLAACLAALAEEAAPDSGRIEMRFEIAYLHGWAPAPGQPQPLRPGSAKMRLADALGAREIALPEKTGR